MLGIKTVVHLTPQAFPLLDKDFKCVHYEVKDVKQETLEVLNLTPFIEQITELLENSGPVFMFCVNGQLSGAIAGRLAMEQNKAFMGNKEIAMASIFSKRYELKDMPTWLYNLV
mmetsp:Transcript_19224/g.29471  ORF Transcript_19224/g.29471 Transcript_19224/m.29471 type:complete len:114 (-) Transcript_19224:3-344(-)